MTNKIYYIEKYTESFKELNANNPREEYTDIIDNLTEMKNILLNEIAVWDCGDITDLTYSISKYEKYQRYAVDAITDLIDEDDGTYTIVPEYIQKDFDEYAHHSSSGFEPLSIQACICGWSEDPERIWDFIPCADVDEYGYVSEFVYAGDKKGNYLYYTYDGMHAKSEIDDYWRVENVFGDEE